VERLIAARGLEWSALSFAELDALWEEAKAALASLAQNDAPDTV
jgi:hypothetical protein